MPNCELFGRKHQLKLTGATDHWLVGTVYFECKVCGIPGGIDRFWLYLSMTKGGDGRGYIPVPASN